MLPILLQSLVLHFTCVRICNDDSGSVILEDVAASLGTLSSGAMNSVVFNYPFISAMASNSADGLVSNALIGLVTNSPLRKELLFFLMEDVGNDFGIWSLAGDKTMGGGSMRRLFIVDPSEVFHSLAFLHVFDRVSCVS